MTNLSTAYSVFFHGAMETADISKQIYRFPKTDYTTVEFLALEIWTSEEAKKFNFLLLFNLQTSLSYFSLTLTPDYHRHNENVDLKQKAKIS